jgi:SAM-dependent methyltransferase
VRRLYRDTSWLDAGEAVAGAALLERAAGGRLLDLGIGGGRTTALLAPHVAAYLGIDASRGMLDLAREQHPDADLRLGDARALGEIGTFDAAVFSFNGIDSMDHAEREQVLAELHRVLRPGGALLVSMLNLDGPAYGERPLTARPTRGGRRSPRGMAHWLLGLAPGWRNFRRTSRDAERGQDWARWPIAAHEFRFIVHFTTLGAAVGSLRAAGFTVESAWASDGRELDLAAEHSDADSMQFLCRRT